MNAIASFLLLASGGLVTATDSGLAVPDWPLSFGKLTPPLVGGILYEHLHRLSGFLAVLLTTLQVVVTFRVEQRRWVRLFSMVLAGLVAAQIVVGAFAIFLLLPFWISILHALLAPAFFAGTAVMAMITSSWWLNWEIGDDPPLHSSGVIRITLVALTAVFIQLLLGALIRHEHAGLAVPDFPKAYGKWIPAVSEIDPKTYNEFCLQKGIQLVRDEPVTSFQLSLHLAHRYFSVALVVVVAWLAYRLIKLRKGFFRLLGFSLCVLLASGCILGALTVTSGRDIVVTMMHGTMGALLMAFIAISLAVALRITGVGGRMRLYHSLNAS